MRSTINSLAHLPRTSARNAIEVPGALFVVAFGPRYVSRVNSSRSCSLTATSE